MVLIVDEERWVFMGGMLNSLSSFNRDVVRMWRASTRAFNDQRRLVNALGLVRAKRLVPNRERNLKRVGGRNQELNSGARRQVMALLG